jgi:organic radical activating enzyme
MSACKSFCIYPWMHLQLKPNGQAKPCCRFNHMNPAYNNADGVPALAEYNVNKMTLTEISNSEFWKQLRQDMLDGKQIPGCHKCDRDDEHGNFSMRFNANRQWNDGNQDAPLDKYNSLKFEYLELTTGRYCNLKCRMCSSDLSTSWDDDDKVLAGHYYDRKDFSNRPSMLSLDFNEEDFENTKLIKLTGGEPMLAPTFIPFIDKIIDSGYAKNINLEIYTNASWVPKAKILDRLDKFKNLNIFLSIDGLNEVNDYVRAPSKWEVVNESAETWIKYSKENLKYSIVFSPTISLYNILNFPSMLRWWKDLQTTYFGEDFVLHASDNEKAATRYPGYIFNVGRLSPTMLQTPTYLSPCLLPNKVKVAAEIAAISKELVKNATTNSELKYASAFEYMIDHIISHLVKAPVDILQTFVSYSADLDKLRSQKLQDACPELWEQIKDQVEYKGKL